jgi:hypothetical protein
MCFITIHKELKRKRIAEGVIQAALLSFFGEDLSIRGHELMDAYYDMSQEPSEDTTGVDDSPSGQILDLGSRQGGSQGD